MALGVMHDLAVGVNSRGADAWALQDSYAGGVTVGVPPDAFNQHGQDWNQPPWRPDRLAATAYAPFRDMVSTILRHAGGLRVDHVMGLFRLWWIPQGAPSHTGDVRSLRPRGDDRHPLAGGPSRWRCWWSGRTWAPSSRGSVTTCGSEGFSAHRSCGSSSTGMVTDSPLAPEQWREYCLASVTTHDLPPTAGYLAGDHVRLRDQLGILTRPEEELLATKPNESLAGQPAGSGRAAARRRVSRRPSRPCTAT